MVEDGQMRGDVNLIDQVFHDGQRRFAYINPAQGRARQAQHLHAQPVFAIFQVTA